MTVTAQSGSAIGSFLLNAGMALNNMANDFFAGITGLHATSNFQLSNDWTGKASNIAMQTAGLFIGPEGEAGEAITITQTGLKHVLDGHVAGGVNSAGKSLFNAGADVKALIKGAESTVPETLPNGDLRFTVDAGSSVGVDRSTGSATSKYTVVTDASRNLLTAHPEAYK